MPKVKTPAKQTINSGNAENVAPKLMAKILDDSQRSVASHARSLTALSKLYRQDSEVFFDELRPHLNKILLVFKKETCIERLMTFISSFVTQADLLSEEERDEAAETLLKYLVRRANAKDKAVRYRVCQLIAMIVDKMADDAELDDDLFDEISEILMTRAIDSAPVVRATSVEALHRMQEDCKDDPVVEQMAKRMQSDSSKEVRVAALKHIAVNTFTLNMVLERLCDVSEQVRATAYRVLRDRAQLRYLNLSQRAELVRRGLKDRVPAVKEECLQLIIQAWLPATDNDITKLCARSNIPNNPYHLPVKMTILVLFLLHNIYSC